MMFEKRATDGHPLPLCVQNFYRAARLGIIPNLLAALGNSDAARTRIFDADNRRGQGCFHLATLKAKVSFQHFAIHKLEPLTVAKRLRANDFAIYEGHILAIPTEVFPFDCAVGENHVFGVPKGILGVKIAILKIGICDVLEGIFARKLNTCEA